MVIKKQAVFNAANLSLWMINLSYAVLKTNTFASMHFGRFLTKKLFQV